MPKISVVVKVENLNKRFARTKIFRLGENMKRKKTSLRNFAAQAKSRLVTGFWNEKHTVKERIYTLGMSDEEEQFHNRVVKFLRDGISPLTQVLDRAHMDALDEVSRQRYVLNTSMRVQKSIERYNKVC